VSEYPGRWNSAAKIVATAMPTGYHHHGVRSDSRYSVRSGPEAGDACGVWSASALTLARVALPAVTPSHPLEILIHRIDPSVPLPSYALAGDAGADIVTSVDVRLAPGQRSVVSTGLAMVVPDGYAAFVHPRSGLAARAGMSLVNAPGTIDSGYRGEIKVIVINHDPVHELVLTRGDRIAQLVFQRVEHARFIEVTELPSSDRGTGGHGSTGGAAALDRAPLHRKDGPIASVSSESDRGGC
jgi:dUTP pyrophosphatase